MSKLDPGLRRGLPPAAAGIPVPSDRRFRRSDIGQGRRRNWRSLLKRAAWVSGAGVVVLAVVAFLGHVLLGAAVLQVDHIAVRGNARVSIEEIDSRLEGMRGQNILHVDLEIFAPKILTRPWKTTRIFFRQRARKFDIVEGICVLGDYAERIDADGDHVFVPVEKTIWGNIVPKSAGATR